MFSKYSVQHSPTKAVKSEELTPNVTRATNLNKNIIFRGSKGDNFNLKSQISGITCVFAFTSFEYNLRVLLVIKWP